MLTNSSNPFGALLKHFRKRQHLTQQQLAQAIGIHRNTIGRWEEGSFLPESKTLILELARCLRLTEPEARQLLDAGLLTPTPIWSVPYSRNPFFTGREELLATLYAYLSPGQCPFPQSYALHGMGGIGKTQLALEYAYRYALAYHAVFWIGAETLEQIHASLLHIAQRLELPERLEADQQRMVAAVQHWLEIHSEWLLIWDNLEDLELLLHFLPSLQHGTVLITTRQQALGTIAHKIDLPPMEAEEGLLLLLRRAKILESTATAEQARELAVSRPAEYTAARDLVTSLGGLPLALDQAGAYLEETHGRLTEYMALFQHAPLRLLQERGTHVEHPASVVTTFTLAFEHLQMHHPAAAELLTACCFLAPEEIPECLFTRHAVLLPPALQAALVEPFEFQELMKRLLAYALIQRQPDRQTLVIHRLVQAVLRERLERHEQQEWRKRMLQVLNVAFPEVTHDVWDTCERLLPHVLAVVAHFPEQEIEGEILAEVLRKAADYLRERAHYEQAETLYQRASNLIERAKGPEDLSVACLLHHLAFLSFAQGKYKKAEYLGERATYIRERVLGPMHPDVAKSLNSLANFALEQGKYEQAELLHRRVLRIREQVFGSEHPALATSFNNLGILAAELGNEEQAELMYQRSLAIFEQILKPDHPEVAGPLNNLAMLYTEQGKYEQARVMGQRAFTIWEQTLGPQHPLVAEGLKTLARLSTEQGEYEQAASMYQRVLALFEQALGPEHPQVASTLNGLANLSRMQGKNEQAEAWYQRALSIRIRSQGEYHPETAQTLYDLAVFHQQRGNLHEALSLAERALQIRMQSLGSTHAKTALSQAQHTRLLQELEHATYSPRGETMSLPPRVACCSVRLEGISSLKSIEERTG